MKQLKTIKISMVIILLGISFNSDLFAQDWGDTEKIVAVIGATSHRDNGDRFSGQNNALDIDGDYAIVGSEYEDKNVNNTGASVTNAGAA
jgi:hypothetical protein